MIRMMTGKTLFVLVGLLPLAAGFQFSALSSLNSRSVHACVRPQGLRSVTAQMPDAPEKITIPDTFNPAEWGGGGGGLGGGGFKVPDSFNPAQFEKEKEGGRTAVLDRPGTQRTDPEKKYKVLLFNDESNTRQYVTSVLMKYIPGMTQPQAKEITDTAHNTGMAVVGVWMFELAEGYSEILRSQGLRSDIEKE